MKNGDIRIKLRELIKLREIQTGQDITYMQIQEATGISLTTLVDWGKDPKQMNAAFLEQGVQIGRSWTAYPTASRITVGSAEEMQKFRLALDRILTS